GDLNPFYLDDRVGAASEWGDVIAPPTFAVTFRDERADAGALLRDLGVDIARVLHGEQEFEIVRSEEHSSELQSRSDLVCRLLLEKKKKTTNYNKNNNYTKTKTT